MENTKNAEVWVVTVYENGDSTTSPWGVYFDEKEAEKHKADLLKSDLNKDGYYLVVEITKHNVLKKFEE